MTTIRSWFSLQGFNGNRRRATTRRSFRLEPLETRNLLDGAGVVWNDTSQLTLSFVPDGTDIGGEPSALFEELNQLAPPRQWKDTILRAFQTWAVHTTVNIGNVGDRGLPMGTPGPRTQDTRFGDIRIGSRSLSGDVMALGVSQNSVVAGTWAGDVIFNSEATFNSLEDLYAVALHEAGHAFGLEHSEDPASPMHSHGRPTSTSLTTEDIKHVRQLHGRRVPDPHEENNSFRTATLLVDPAPDHALQLPPILVYGDLTTRDDVDYFALPNARRFAGPLTVRLQSSGISLLAPSVRVLNSDGTEVGRSSSPRLDGATILIRLDDADPNERYFIEVDSARDDVFAIGAYSLVVSFDSVPQVDAANVDEVVTGRIRDLNSQQLQSLLGDPNALLNADISQDNQPENANNLQVTAGFSSATRFEQVASISESRDVDFFRFSTRGLDAARVLNLTVRSLRPGGLIPQAVVLDARREPVESEILVNGNGEFVLQARLEAGTHYFVRIEADDSEGPFRIGNYRLTIALVDEWVQMDAFMEGKVNAEAPMQMQALYVARPQLFHFAMDTSSEDNQRAADQVVIVNFWNSDRELLSRVSGPLEGTRTSHGILLMPGVYAVQAFTDRLTDRPIRPAAFLLRGTSFSDPFGVDPEDPTEDPIFVCPDEEELFCYPGGIISDDPFLWDEFLDTLPEIPDLEWSELISALLGDWWAWYWNSTGQNGPVLALQDAYQTEVGAPLIVDEEHGVLANDLDPEGEAIAAFVVSDPSHGSLTFNTDGSFSYAPNPGFAGLDQFTYVASDFLVDSEPTVVQIEVIGDGVLPGDLNDDQVVDADDVDILCDVIKSGIEDEWYDLSGDLEVDIDDLHYLILDILGSSIGDSNLDGGFGTADMIAVFQAGYYENPSAGEATWATGDWNCDGYFDSGDLIAAFQAGGFSPAFAVAQSVQSTMPDPGQLDEDRFRHNGFVAGHPVIVTPRSRDRSSPITP